MNTVDVLIAEIVSVNTKVYAHFEERVRAFCEETGFGYDCGMGSYYIEYKAGEFERRPYFFDDDIIGLSIDYYKQQLEYMATCPTVDYIHGYEGAHKEHKMTAEMSITFESMKKRMLYGIEVCQKFLPIIEDVKKVQAVYNDMYILENLKCEIKPKK
jgi:hypothetical protein